MLSIGTPLNKVLKNVLCGCLAGVSNLTMSGSPKKVVKKPVWPKVARYEWPPNWPIQEALPEEEEEENRPPSSPPITHLPTPPTSEMSNVSFQSVRARTAAPPAPAVHLVTP